jgi:hypothetical protein
MRELNHWTDADEKEYIEELDDWKEVGMRGSDGFPWSDQPEKGPSIEFYSTPRTRFVFASDERFHEVWGTIRRLGWKMTDMS